MASRTFAPLLLVLGLVVVGCSNPASGGSGSDGLGVVTPTALPGIGRATVTWPPVEFSTGYVLEWSADPAFPPGATTVVPDATSPFVLDDLEPGTQRHFRVAAVWPSGRGAWASGSVTLDTSWTWSRVVETQRFTTQDTELIDLGNGDFVVFIRTHFMTIELLERFSLGATGVTWETVVRTTDTVDGSTPPVVTLGSPVWSRGDLPTGSTLTLTEIDTGTGWVPLDPVVNHTVTSSADRTLLVIDGDTTKPLRLYP